jgi:hypothetical protein
LFTSINAASVLLMKTSFAVIALLVSTFYPSPGSQIDIYEGVYRIVAPREVAIDQANEPLRCFLVIETLASGLGAATDATLAVIVYSRRGGERVQYSSPFGALQEETGIRRLLMRRVVYRGTDAVAQAENRYNGNREITSALLKGRHNASLSLPSVLTGGASYILVPDASEESVASVVTFREASINARRHVELTADSHEAHDGLAEAVERVRQRLESRGYFRVLPPALIP